MPGVDFLSAGNSKDVRSDRLAIAASVRSLAKGVTVVPLIDRDDHSSDDMTELQTKGYTVLSRRHLECYLFDDEIMGVLCESEGKPAEKTRVLGIKATAVTESVGRGNPPDDMKSAAGDIVVELRKALKLYGKGNDTEAFIRNVLCPLVRPGTKAYDDLRRDIFGA